LTSAIRLDRYSRGEWKKVMDLNPTCKSGELKAGGLCWQELTPEKFGKYRIVVSGPVGYEYFEARSNEFYKKKL
jgi:hypothetical protein